MQILNGISNRTWNAIIEHAICFVNDNKLYAYQRPEQDIIIYFNSILKVEGANFNGQFCPVNAFTPSQKVPFRVIVINVVPLKCFFVILETDKFPHLIDRL